MAGSTVTDDSAASTAGMGDDDRSLSGESLSEWRSCERAESDSPSTSPPFWDTDGDDDDPGPKPSDLFGRYTWRIENFSKEKKREMKSEPFEAGGYKWYILVYPQGCDVSNHLSLFLCVANHDKLLPGWSHFAQFTIAVGNIDPKKMKYSDTLHRFWKKEHDWGWKKFMELSKIQDGFLVDDVLEIIAQVQVIREKVDRPFRCLDRPYRRELLRVYMTNVEQIYRRFVEEQRSKLSKLIEDKMRWSSFRAFWSAIDPSARHRMSREKTDTILKVLVKHFFVEKEVTSTLVMDSLNTSLKALEYQMKGKKGSTKLADLEELPAPMVHVDMDMFVLAGDVISLLERAALEPSPCQPLAPKDDKSSQSRMKDGSCGEVYKVSMEREERRLTELGQKILETFVLSHIFSGIEVAYQEAVALKRQEELIREEEEAGLLENQMKGKRGGGANEKDKRAKKKQAKQKKNNRKVKDKERGEKCEVKILERFRDEIAIDDSDGLLAKVEVTAKVDALDEGASDVSDILNRGKNQRNKGLSIISFTEEVDGLPSTSSVAGGSCRNSSGCCTAPKLDQDTVLLTLRDKLRKLGQRLHEKNIEGQKLLKAHFEARDAKAKAAESSNSSSSSEKPPDVPESPKHSSEDTVDLKVYMTPNNDAPAVNYMPEESVSSMPATTNTEPVSAPASTKVDPVSNKDNASSSKMKANIASPCCSKLPAVDMDKDAPLPSKSPRINKAAPIPPKSPSVDKATPVPSKSPAVDKITPVRPKSPAVDKATPPRPKSPAVDKAAPVHPKSPAVDKSTLVRPKSPLVDKASSAPPKSPSGAKDVPFSSRSLQIDKSIPAPPRLPQVDKAALPSLELPQASLASNSKAQEETTAMKVRATSVSEVATTTSRPSSAPVLPTPSRSTARATSQVQVSMALSRSMSEAAGRSINGPSPSALPYVPQTYRNAIVGKPSLGTTSGSLAYLSTSLGQNTTFLQPLSTYASSTTVMIPPAGRSDQLSGRHGFKSGLGMSEAHDSWQPWNGDSNVDKHLWRDHSPYQQMANGQACEQPWKDDTYQQASSRGAEKLSRFGGLQPRQFQSGATASHVWHQPQGPVAEEFPHLDIINDLLEEDHMPRSIHYDYHAFDMPFSPKGNVADLEMASVSNPGRFNSTERYYGDGFLRAYDMSNFNGLRERQFPSMGAYSNGLSDMSVSKPLLNVPPNTSISVGGNTSGFPHQLGDYSNLGSGVNGVSVWRRHANGRW
ncbi:TNF receptor-associated factor homolog 1b-like [Phragmites australis]|uniref:TNF receptor-associated factor homolog 1b-like n=1 Tax=Phragmites australis TaxID=29695 RepID=UPI002D76F0C0|nr:TNF receptor-associated factor homolog 1b-like [Phragmites australis]